MAIETIRIDMGSTVLCDDCSKNYTELPDVGGILFQSKAIGPCCSAKWLDGAEKYNEQQFVRARCPEGKSFADWVREDLR